MRRRASWAAGIVAGCLVVAGTVEANMADGTQRPATIQEDDPGWDCTRMGNRVCGPVFAVVRADGGVEVWSDGGRRPLVFVEPDRVAWEGEGGR